MKKNSFLEIIIILDQLIKLATFSTINKLERHIFVTFLFVFTTTLGSPSSVILKILLNRYFLSFVMFKTHYYIRSKLHYSNIQKYIIVYTI